MDHQLGFADVFFVFCKIENDEKPSCLIVHKEWGEKLGEEKIRPWLFNQTSFFRKYKSSCRKLIG